MYLQVQQCRMSFKGRNSLEGHQSENTGWLRKFANVSILTLHVVVLFSICTRQENFYFFICLFVVFCFWFEPDKFAFASEEQTVAHSWQIWYFCHTVQPCSYQWYRLLETKWQHPQLCFCNFQMSGFNKWDWKLSEKNVFLWCVCLSSLLFSLSYFNIF